MNVTPAQIQIKWVLFFTKNNITNIFWNSTFSNSLVNFNLYVSRTFLPSATKLRRLCFYTCLWFCSQVGCYPSMHCRWYPSMSCSAGGWLLQSRVPALEGVCSRGVPALGGCLLWGVLIPGGCMETPLPKADGYCCGRYASYWNAFWFLYQHITVYQIRCKLKR